MSSHGFHCVIAYVDERMPVMAEIYLKSNFKNFLGDERSFEHLASWKNKTLDNLKKNSDVRFKRNHEPQLKEKEIRG